MNDPMNDPIKTIPLTEGRTFEIFQDFDPENPRNWDNLSTMVCFHKRYDLGDKHDYNKSDFQTWSDLRARIEKDHDPAVCIPLYMFDHSGVSIGAGWETEMRFRQADGAGWDWGQIGYVFVSKEKVRKEYLKKRLSKKTIERATRCVMAEVETYNQWQQGDVYGFVLKDAAGETIDSCWGFYGSDPAENGMAEGFSEDIRKQLGVKNVNKTSKVAATG